MRADQKLIVIGDGGHSSVIQDLIDCRAYSILAILDDRYSTSFVQDGILRGPVDALGEFFQKDAKLVMAIGSNDIRKKVVERIGMTADMYATLIHPSSFVSKRAVVEPGTVVMPNAVINAGAIIGAHSIINTGSIVEHDCCLAPYVHVCPGSTLTGAVTVGEGTQISAGATLVPGVSIGEWSVIAAGAVVTQSIPAYRMAAGCPANIKKRIDSRERIL
ncbi:acetyltransferase [Jeotgalibacillus proteolyticus]|uniref:acetyltransferase n=1 Tax=Jeotgalibacillus proteolyticus TaxID=2082395 RepID=UPI003CED8C2A